MRIIATPDNTVNYIDRAIWLTTPFDKWWGASTPTWRVFTPPLEDRVCTPPLESRVYEVPSGE